MANRSMAINNCSAPSYSTFSSIVKSRKVKTALHKLHSEMYIWPCFPQQMCPGWERHCSVRSRFLLFLVFLQQPCEMGDMFKLRVSSGRTGCLYASVDFSKDHGTQDLGPSSPWSQLRWHFPGWQIL